jgi:hypothetical protein
LACGAGWAAGAGWATAETLVAPAIASAIKVLNIGFSVEQILL